MAAFLVIGLFGLLAVGVPVGIALAGVGMAGTSMMVGLPAMMSILKTLPIDVAQSYELITIPMFILMAELVVVSGVAEKLFEAMAIWLGRVKGGLAVATALAGAGMGAISGSSTAAAAALVLDLGAGDGEGRLREQVQLRRRRGLGHAVDADPAIVALISTA